MIVPGPGGNADHRRSRPQADFWNPTGVLTLLLDADALCTWGWRVVIPLVLLVLAGVGVLAIERASARACGCRW
jgi:hypothetical protein